MDLVKVDDIKVGQKIEKSLFDEKGRLLLVKGTLFTEKNLKHLKKNGIEELRLGQSGTSSGIVSNSVAIQIKDLEIGSKVAGDLFTEKGVFLLPKGTQLTSQHLNYFKSHDLVKVYEKILLKKQNEEIEIKINKKKIDDLEKEIEKGQKIISEKPQGTPFSEKIKSSNLITLNPAIIEKAEFDYCNIIDQVEDVFYSLNQGIHIDRKIIEHIVEDLLDWTIREQPLLLSFVTRKKKERGYLFRHSVNTAILCINVAANMGYNESQIVDLAVSSLTFDSGMLKIPELILNSKRPLKDYELNELKNHVMYSVNMISHIGNINDRIKTIVYQSHENSDGSGYPKRRKDYIINNYSKILRIADIYEALINERPYRAALLPYTGMEKIVELCGKGLLDGVCVRAFIRTLSLFPLGSYVRIYDDRVGEVIGVSPKHYDRPVVRILYKQNRTPLKLPEVIDLQNVKNQNKIIKGILDIDAFLENASS